MIAVSVAFFAYWAITSLLIHRSFHSNAWDLGVITQVLWNTSRGDPFEYSFRSISYAGDHFQPVLLLFVPLFKAGGGAESLLIAQAAVIALAALPLGITASRQGRHTQILTVLAFCFSLGVARAVSFDFHAEAVIPLFAFIAIWAFNADRPLLFVSSSLMLLSVKEDAILLTASFLIIAAYYKRWYSITAIAALVALIYAVIVNLWLIPHFRGNDLNPLRERYGYLGDSVPQIMLGLLAHPVTVAAHLLTWDALAIAVLLIMTSGLALIARPVLGLCAIPLLIVPLLSSDPNQNSFHFHYLLVPTTFAISALVLHLGMSPADRSTPRVFHSWPAKVAMCSSIVVAIMFSPIPPSFGTEWGRYHIDNHSRTAAEFVGMIPDNAIVSAQSPFVPHLATRREIYDFPRVLTAEYVLLDAYGPKPTDDLAAGYESCKGALPRLGFVLKEEKDGISLWRKEFPAELVTDAPVSCTGQRP